MEIHDVPPDKLHEFAKVMGKKGGLATKEKYGTEHYREMRKRSAGRTKKPETGTKR